MACWGYSVLSFSSSEEEASSSEQRPFAKIIQIEEVATVAKRTAVGTQLRTASSTLSY